MNIGDIFFAFRGESQQLMADAEKAGQAAGTKAGAKFGDVFSSKVAAGAAVAGMAVGAFAAAGIQDFAKFEKGMAEVFTLMPDITDKAMGEMQEDVKDFANETGRLPDDIIPALYNSLSAGVPRENVFEFLREANQLALAGATDVGVAVDALTSVTNAYGRENLSAAKASDILFTGVKQGKTTVDELSGAISVVAPLAAGLGIGFDSVTAAMAAMTSQGEPTAGAATKLKGLMAELAQPTSKISTLFQDLAGESFPDFIAGGGTVQEALGLIGEHAEDTGVSASTLANSVEAGMALMMLTSDTGAAQFGDNMDAMADSTGAVTGAAETMAGTIEHQTSLIVAKIKTMSLDVGEFLAPFGPFVMLFGPQLGRGIGAAVGGIAGFISGAFIKLLLKMIPSLIPASVATGSATGTAQGTAHTTAATGATVVKALFTRIAAMAIPLAPAGTTVGTAVGAAMSAAMVLGVALGAVAVVHATAQLSADASAAAAAGIRNNPNAITAEDIFQMRAPGWAVSKLRVAQEMQGLGVEALAAFNEEWDVGIAAGLSPQAALGPARDAGLVIGAQLTEAWRTTIEQGMGEPDLWQHVTDLAGVAGAAAGAALGENMGRATMTEFGDVGLMDFASVIVPPAAAAGQTAGERLTASLAAATTNAQSTHTLLDGINTLKDAIQNYLSPREQALKLIGSDYMKWLREGMESEDHALKRSSQDLAIGAINTIEDAGLTGKKGQKGLRDIGILYDQLLASGMTAESARTALIAGGVASETIDAMETKRLQAEADAAGVSIGSAWVQGVIDRLRRSGTPAQIANAATWAMHQIQGNSPPKDGPLHNIDKWGENIGMAWLGGVQKGMSGFSAMFASPRFALPAMASPNFATSPSAVGGNTYNVNVGGLLRAETPEDIGRVLRRVGSLGLSPSPGYTK